MNPFPDSPKASASGSASSGPSQRSEYMHWAKTRQAARFNLAVSGVPAVSLRELPVTLEDLEVNGPAGYGWPPLQEALARHLGVGPDRIVQVEGTSLANHLAMAVCVRPGDEILIEHPAYELLVSAARYLGATVGRFPRRPEDGFQPDLEALRAAVTSRTRLIVLTDLHNPTSAKLSSESLDGVIRLAAQVGARVLIDEVYLDAVFDPDAATAHRLGDHVLTTSSLTKVYGLSGLRCGWVVAAPALVERMWRLNDLFGVNAAHPAQRLSRVALGQAPVLRRRVLTLLAENRRRWREFVAARPELVGVTPEYGTVVFPRLVTGNVGRLCEVLREEFETTVVPGHFFEMPDHLRVGLGMPTGMFEEGLRRLGLALDRCRSVG